MQNPTHKNAAAGSYVAQWFWRLPQLAQAVALEEAATQRLIQAGCAPGPVYAWHGQWWSALSACQGIASPSPPEEAELWYSRSAAWDLRRALLLMRDGATPDAAAIANLACFTGQFVACLSEIKGAQEAFPQCWPGDRFDPDLARVAAGKEWATWLQGAYGVCLRVFNARNCIRKETLAARMKRRIADAAPLDLLDDAQDLAALILPFAPWERAAATPGLTIDALLAQARLGDDQPYC